MKTILSSPIVFENDHFVVLDKQSGVLTVPSRLGVKESRLCLGIELEKQLGKKIYPVHRLDFEVSGVVLYALTAEAHRESNVWFEGKKVEKTYEAFSDKTPSTVPSEIFHWKSFIVRGKKRSFEAPYGDLGETVAQATHLVTAAQTLCHWKLNPITGRAHQLRFELSKRGFPILGDELYGSQFALAEKDKIALRAVELKFQDKAAKDRFGLPMTIKLASLSEVFKF